MIWLLIYDMLYNIKSTANYFQTFRYNLVSAHICVQDRFLPRFYISTGQSTINSLLDFRVNEKVVP